MDVHSDSYVLAHTTREGKVWAFPPLNFKAEMGDGTPFQQATTWCTAVRSEYERQESEKAAKASRAGASARHSQREDSSPEERTGGGDRSEIYLSDFEEAPEEYLARQVEELEKDAERKNSKAYDLEQEALQLRQEVESSQTKIKKLKKALEVLTTNSSTDGRTSTSKSTAKKGPSRRKSGESGSSQPKNSEQKSQIEF